MYESKKEGLRSSAISWLVDVLSQSSKAITSGIVVLTALVSISAWVYATFLQENIAAEVKELNGTPEILSAVEGIAYEQAEQRILIEDLSDRVDGLEPEPVVVVFDPLRSWIEEECTIGEPCMYGFFARRANNVYGTTCRTTASERVFVDSSGVEHFPAREGQSRPRTLTTTPTMVTGNFIPPQGALEGDGEFFLRVTYSECGPNGDEIVKRETMKLVTRIVQE